MELGAGEWFVEASWRWHALDHVALGQARAHVRIIQGLAQYPALGFQEAPHPDWAIIALTDPSLSPLIT